MIFAKFITEDYVNKTIPAYADIDGKRYFNIRANETIMRSIGYLPLTETTMPSNAPEGKHYVRKYKIENEALVDSWVLVDNPVVVHTYKKSYLAQWFWVKGRLEDLESFMQSNATAKFYWEYSTEFDSDHPQWNTLIEAVCSVLELTEEERNEMLYFGEHGKNN